MQAEVAAAFLFYITPDGIFPYYSYVVQCLRPIRITTKIVLTVRVNYYDFRGLGVVLFLAKSPH